MASFYLPWKQTHFKYQEIEKNVNECEHTLLLDRNFSARHVATKDLWWFSSDISDIIDKIFHFHLSPDAVLKCIQLQTQSNASETVFRHYIVNSGCSKKQIISKQ